MAEPYPTSVYPHDVPGQVTGEHEGYFFRVRPVGSKDGYTGTDGDYIKEVWDQRNRFYWQGRVVGKARGVEEIKERIDLYIEEEGPQEQMGFLESAMRGPTWWAANPIEGMPGESVSGCIELQKKKPKSERPSDPGAYCAAIADRIEPGWRKANPRDVKKLKTKLLR